MPNVTGIKRPYTQIGRMSFRHTGLRDYTRTKVVLTGTIITTPTATTVRAGGTVIITLTGNQWLAAGSDFNGTRQAIIDSLDSAQSEAAGWNAQVRDSLGVSTVVRTSATVVTVTVPATSGFVITTSETITATIADAALLKRTDSDVVAESTLVLTHAAAATITGTFQSTTIVEEDIISGGADTFIITLVDATWAIAAGGLFDAQRQNIIDGLDSSASETTGWNTEVRDKEVVGSVIRTSNTIATVTISTASAYNITASEVITVTVPASATTHTAALTGNVTVTVNDPVVVATGTMADGTATEAEVVTGSNTIILTLTNDTWSTNVGNNHADNQALIDGITGSVPGGSGWDDQVRNNLDNTDITRTSATIVTIIVPARASYALVLGTNETITVLVPAAALVTSSLPLDAVTFSILAQAEVALTGTAVAGGVLESQIVSGGETLILTLTDDTWVSDIGNNGTNTTSLLAGITGNHSEGGDWDTIVMPLTLHPAVVRTSSTVVTITFPAAASYAITTTDEIVSVVVPSSSLTTGSVALAVQTFTITEGS